MKERIKTWVTHNLLYKIIALVIAILLWLTFSVSEDLMGTEDFTIPVTVEHLDEFRNQNHYIELDGEEDLSNLKLQVYIKARKSVLEVLKTKDATSFMRAYVDVYELEDSSVNRLMIHYEITDLNYINKFQFNELRNKSYYEVDIDESISKEIEVRYDIQGTPMEGYIFLQEDPAILVTPDVITITGPANQIEEIAYGKVTIRVDQTTANVSKKSNIVLYNGNDEIVSYSRDIIWASVSEAGVFVPIYATKTVPVQASLVGSVPDGYEYGKDTQLSVAEIQIYGPESTINKVNSIILPSVDLSQLTENYQKTYDFNEVLAELYPKGDVKLREGSEQSTELTFSVEKQVSKSITVDTSQISLYGQKEGWNVFFTNTSISFDIVGIQENIDNFDSSALNLSIHLKEGDYAIGKRMVQVDIAGLGKVSLKNSSVMVEIEMKPDTQS
jgi:YbbR domain-containing protein